MTLEIKSSSVVAILGSNGSGKSTFVKACLGLAPIQSGTVSIFGTEFSHFKDRNRLGYVPQRIHDAMEFPQRSLRSLSPVAFLMVGFVDSLTKIKKRFLMQLKLLD